MSSGYTKLFNSITDSTIWTAPDTTRIVWITMLAMSDQNGYVGASVPGLAARARVSIESCLEALESFLSPDKWSRTPDFEGRRIAVHEGGWILLNHEKYRAVLDKEARKERARIAMAELRSKRKNVSNVSNVSLGEPQLPQAEVDTEAEALKSNTIVAIDAGRPSCPHQEIIALWHAILPSAVGVKDWTPARSAMLKARWCEDEKRQNMEFWDGLFKYIAGIPFLTGGSVSPGRKPFMISLPWLLKAENFAKVREGNYE